MLFSRSSPYKPQAEYIINKELLLRKSILSKCCDLRKENMQVAAKVRFLVVRSTGGLVISIEVV